MKTGLKNSVGNANPRRSMQNDSLHCFPRRIQIQSVPRRRATTPLSFTKMITPVCMEIRSDWAKGGPLRQHAKFVLNPFQFSFVADSLIELVRGVIDRQRCTGRQG